MRRWLVVVTALFGLVSSRPALARAAGDETSTWASLDAELEALAAGLPSQEGQQGFRAGLILRTSYAYWDESPDGPGTYSGFALDDVRPWFEGEVADTTVKVQLEALGGTVLLLDAFARFEVWEGVQATFGRFQTELLRSGLIEPQSLLFLLRARSGQLWQDARDAGIQVAGDFEPVRVSISAQNGGDGTGDDGAYTLRADLHALNRGSPDVEGAWGSGRKTRLSFGLGYRDDQSASTDGEVLALDLAATLNRLAVYAEWLDYGDDAGLYAGLADTSPWSVTGSFMIDKDKVELALRYEDPDDADDTSVVTVGVNRYLAGHDAKWVVNYARIDSDLASQDGDVFGIGLTGA